MEWRGSVEGEDCGEGLKERREEVERGECGERECRGG